MECTKCKVEKSAENYYVQDGRRFRICKECLKGRRREIYEKKPTGFSKLPEEAQKLIIDDLKLMKMKVVSKKHGLSYPTLCYWKRTKQIPLDD